MTDYATKNPADSKDVYGIPSRMLSDNRIRPWGMGKRGNQKLDGRVALCVGVPLRMKEEERCQEAKPSVPVLLAADS